MTILAIECSGKVVSLALAVEDDRYELTLDRGFRHAETLMPAVDALVRLAGIEARRLDLVACSAGPGSFTALRIGMSTAKGLARGADAALKAVPTLPVLAAGREHWPGIVVPVMDARKKRIYAAAFRKGIRLRPDADIELEAFFDDLPGEESVLVTGPDAEIAAGRPGVVVDPRYAEGRGRALLEAARSAWDAEGGDPPDIGPIYLRLSEAEEALQADP